MSAYFLAATFFIALGDVRSGPRWDNWKEFLRRIGYKGGQADMLAYAIAGLLLASLLFMAFSVLVVHRAKCYAQRKRLSKKTTNGCLL